MWSCFRARSFPAVAAAIAASIVTISFLDSGRSRHVTVVVPTLHEQPEDFTSLIQSPTLLTKSLESDFNKEDLGTSVKHSLAMLQAQAAVRVKTILGIMSAHILGLSMFTFVFGSACCVGLAVGLSRVKNALGVPGTSYHLSEDSTAKEQLHGLTQSQHPWSFFRSFPSWFSFAGEPLRSRSQAPVIRSAPPLFSPVTTALFPNVQMRVGIPLSNLSNFINAPRQSERGVGFTANCTQNGELGIVDPYGELVLRAIARMCGNARSIELVENNHARPHARIAPSSLGALAIFNSQGGLYGFLETDGPETWSVEHDAKKVIVMQGCKTGLHFVLSTSGKKRIASVGRSSDFTDDDAEHVEFRIEPGVDAVLIIATVLAVLLINPSATPTPTAMMRSPGIRGRLS